MHRRERRIARVVDWIMEASVLLAILPVVDQLVSHGVLAPVLTLATWLAAGVALSMGLYLTRDE